jgi:very-short-patch-repair endonuclease
MTTYLRKYLCGKIALDYWKVPNLRGVIEPEKAEFALEHVIFTDQSLYRPQGIKIHTCRIKGAEQYTKKGVCTLPLVFLQVANDYSIHELIYLGLQICSYPEKGKPLCSVQELYTCAKKLTGHRGRKKALRAIRYLDNGSRSPMESILYMFLRLPNALGGCAFTEIRLNQKLTLRKSKTTYFADLYVPSCKLDIEYDSQTHHDSPTAYSSDSIRSANLEREGYQILSIKPVQLYNLKHFETLAINIARRIGKRIRIRARKFFESFAALRDLLSKEGRRIRSRFKKTELFEFPNFPGVSRMYRVYLDAWKRLFHYPNQTLVLTRAP